MGSFWRYQLGGTSIIDISVNNGQNDPIFHKETNRHTRDKYVQQKRLKFIYFSDILFEI